MPVNIDYDNNRKLVIPKIECDCGMPHENPDIDIYIGSNIINNCVKYIDARNFGKNAVLVADLITYKIAGKKVEDLLQQAGYSISLCLLEREKELEPDESAIGEIMYTLEKKTDFLIAVGSGSINDLTRYVAVNIKKPFVSVGTAPSMDGYTSVVAPLLNRGLKINKPATYPKVLICDLEIMRNAPYPMLLSGFGDVLGKYIAIADWRVGRIINGETYCPVAVDIVDQAVRKCVDNIDGIKAKSEVGVQSLIEALILAGLTILMIGHTRPVASVEHNMAHYWEMMKLLRKEHAPSHGTAVGVATGYVVKFYEEFLKLNPANLNKAEIKAKRLAREAREKFLCEKYGSKFAASIIKENPDDFLTWEEQERRIDAFIQNFDLIKKEVALVPSWPEVKAIYQRLGSPITAAEIGIDDRLLEDTMFCAKDYRSRYTIFKTADEIGVLDEIVAKVLRS